MVRGGGKQGGVDGREGVGVDGWGWWEGGKQGGSMESYRFSPHCIPAVVLPLLSAPSTQTSSSFQAPPEFEDVMQMIEWLILIESKLQPEKITVGDFVQLQELLRDIQVQESIIT